MKDGVAGYPMGNRDPNKRGLNKNMKNLKRNNKNKGCPLSMILFVVLLAIPVTGIVILFN